MLLAWGCRHRLQFLIYFNTLMLLNRQVALRPSSPSKPQSRHRARLRVSLCILQNTFPWHCFGRSPSRQHVHRHTRTRTHTFASASELKELLLDLRSKRPLPPPYPGSPAARTGCAELGLNANVHLKGKANVDAYKCVNLHQHRQPSCTHV